MTSALAQELTSEVTTAPTVPRLAYVEGLRGIAAFIVMAGHAMGMVPPSQPKLSTWSQSTLFDQLTWPFLFGSQMVALFIMVSGFSLYYSEARRRSKGHATSLKEFALRRAWRILPTYYTALFISLAMIALLPAMRAHTGTSMDVITPVTWSGLLSHLTMVHNLNPVWAHQINAPLWSIPVEVQLYVIFPLVAWAMLRWNPWLGAVTAFALTKLVQAAIPLPLLKLAIFFIGGMLTAHIAMRFERLPYRWPLAAGLVILGFCVWRGPNVAAESATTTVLWLIAFSGLLIGLFQAPTGGWNLPTWTPIRRIGAFSYSLYAIHYPLVFWLHGTLPALGWARHWTVVLMLVLGSGLSLIAAWLLYVTVERWSLTMGSGTRP